jgi:hypothetical protein
MLTEPAACVAGFFLPQYFRAVRNLIKAAGAQPVAVYGRTPPVTVSKGRRDELSLADDIVVAFLAFLRL